MQNRYAGDVGDFGKYGLLRYLCGKPALLSLGIVWYLVSDEPFDRDAKHTRYLARDHERGFRVCDPELYDALREVVSDRREVAAVESSGVLGDAAFFGKPVEIGNREAWLREPWPRWLAATWCSWTLTTGWRRNRRRWIRCTAASSAAIKRCGSSCTQAPA